MTKSDQPSYARGLRVLSENPDGLTAVELATELDIAKRNILIHVRRWRNEKKIHICNWRREASSYIPVYGLSSNPNIKDRQKPLPPSDREKQANKRAQKRAKEVQLPLFRSFLYEKKPV